MKRKYILLTILLAVLFIFSGCKFGGEKIDLDYYHQQGESWCISNDQSEYNIYYITRHDNTMQIDIDIFENPVNGNNIYVYSKGYQIIYNGELCYESVVSMPIFIPVGLYELPFEGNKVSFKIITEKEDFKGYIQVALENLPTSGGVKQALRFKVF